MSAKKTKSAIAIPASVLVMSTGLLLSACNQKVEYDYLHGETMGTSYHISYQLPKGADEADVKAAIDARLQEINESMSTYQEDTTISKFNRLAPNTPIAIDDDFARVLDISRTVYEQSGGAFDPTVLPLIETWGFGSTMTVERLQSPPSAKEIEAAYQLIGFDNVIEDDKQIYKTKDGVGLDFSAVAKGYGVDVIADVLKNKYNVINYMVEIGGEVSTLGVNAQRQPWQIAIDAPLQDSTVSERETIAAIRQPIKSDNQMHLATSGNYRNSIVFSGERYSHTIDPLTGKPIVGGAPSVTVSAESVGAADAWATALTAMPYPKALETAKKNNIAALFVVPKDGVPMNKAEHNADDWQVVQTEAMQKLRADKVS
ncbi:MULTISPECIES: FAD:protein FMN transferase [unclassified Psychrobacter]|uniref:FAD:protein FMN transferase n=1 Tax=unclassified Psychrobacter TaxID=196806 RepID=UPI0018F38288|nr:MULTISPECIES: FAD:protein FMN transferase [unclassified Psychrobacter]